MISISLVLNAAKKDVAGVVHAVQGENGARQLDIKICDADGAIMNLAEYTATFYVLKPDDTVVQTPMNVSGDTASVILSLQACAVAGNCLCWVQIVKSGALDLRTDNLVLQVQPCDFDGAIESTNEFTALTQAIEDAQQATSNANAAADEARETAESTAESVINSQKGQPNGIATLDSSGKLAQMPSGVLPVGNGGTGKSSWVPSQLIYPSATSALSQLGFPSVSGSFLRQGTSGAPYWSSPSTVLSAIGALGEDDQAADSAKLGGQLPAYYSNYNNLTNKPSIPSATSTTPKPLGTATVGTSTYYARADHVHKMPSASEVGAVPTTRTVNGKVLSSNIALDAADVGAKFKYDVLFACGESPRIKAGTIQLTKSVLDYNFIIILTCMSSNVYINAYTNLYVPVVFTNGSNTTICGVSNNVINSQLMRFMCKDGQDDDTGLYCYLPYDLNGFGIRHVQGIKLNSNE